jgi:CheY-like chemotaxis protein
MQQLLVGPDSFKRNHRWRRRNAGVTRRGCNGGMTEPASVPGAGEILHPAIGAAPSASAPAGAAPAAGRAGRCALVAGVELALFELLREWLCAAGFDVEHEHGGGHHAVNLLILDVAYPRECGREVVRAAQARHPGVPIIALSPAFTAGAQGSRNVARDLGVAKVLAQPVQREAFIAAVTEVFAP